MTISFVFILLIFFFSQFLSQHQIVAFCQAAFHTAQDDHSLTVKVRCFICRPWRQQPAIIILRCCVSYLCHYGHLQAVFFRKPSPVALRTAAGKAHHETLHLPGTSYVIVNNGRKNILSQLQQTITGEMCACVCVCVSSNRTDSAITALHKTSRSDLRPIIEVLHVKTHKTNSDYAGRRCSISPQRSGLSWKNRLLL